MLFCMCFIVNVKLTAVFFYHIETFYTVLAIKKKNTPVNQVSIYDP